jgi:hypothetical protein
MGQTRNFEGVKIESALEGLLRFADPALYFL